MLKAIASLFSREEKFEDISTILDDLFLSSRPPQSCLRSVTQNPGITHVLDITHAQSQDTPLRISETGWGKLKNVTYLNIPIYDLESVDLIGQLDRAFAFIDEGRSAKGKVLVHCEVGMSRSASVVIGYLIHSNTCSSLIQAYDVVKTARMIISPNFGFCEQLSAYESKKLNLAEQSDFLAYVLIESKVPGLKEMGAKPKRLAEIIKLRNGAWDLGVRDYLNELASLEEEKLTQQV